MPFSNILEVKIFDVYGIDFMGHFSSCGNKCILVVVDYVSKWDEAIASATNDATLVKKFFKKMIFPRFGIREYGVTHKFGLGYHPKTSGQVDMTN